MSYPGLQTLRLEQSVSGSKLQLVQDGVCLCGQGRDTAVVHRGRCHSPFGMEATLYSSELARSKNSSGVFGIGAREVGLGEVLRIEVVSASRCQVSSQLWSNAAPVGVLAAETGAGKFWRGMCRSKAHPWHEQPFRRRSVEAQRRSSSYTDVGPRAAAAST